MFTATDAARELCISTPSFRKWASFIGLASAKYNRGYLYSKEDIAELEFFFGKTS